MVSKPLNQAYFQSEHLLFEPTTPNHDAIALVFAFPNTYTVGITSLGYQVVWANLARRANINVSRWFTDAHESLPRDIEILGLSFSWELDYVNILAALNQFEIPIDSHDRQDHHPLVFGGGSVLTANPEPFAEWFDLVLLGDGEELIGNFLEAYQAVRGASRIEKLRHLAQIQGIYVPQLYHVTYAAPDGAIAAITPIDSDIPAIVHKQTYKGNILSASTVVTERAAWESIFMVEVVRSCPEMCRFCLASYLTLPFRSASIESSLIPAIAQGLTVTNRLGLLGASITQHPEFDSLLDYLAQPQFDQVRLSLASVRTNTLTEKLARILSQRDSRSVTVAIESGSERLRQIINKKLHNDEITQAAINAQVGGLKALKLYGMAGVPMENDRDIEQTIEMLISLKKAAPKLKITFGCSTFVPKSHTPWQWQGVSKTAEKKLQYFRKQLQSKGIDFRPESYKDSLTQALISRGDRRLTKLLRLACTYGDRESPSDGSYKRAFKELRGELPPLEWYVHQDWAVDQILPWQHLQIALPLETLIKHRAMSFSEIQNHDLLDLSANRSNLP